MKWLLVLLLAFSLAACDTNGGNDNDDDLLPTTTMDAVTTPADIETQEGGTIPDTTDGDTTGDDTNSDETTAGSIEISGDVDQTISSQGQLVYISEGTDTPYYELTFSEGLDTLIMITIPEGTAPGTYDLTSPAEPGELGADVSLSREPGNPGAGAADFSQDVQGVLTLDEIGTEADSMVSGSFEFMANNTTSVDDTDAGETEDQEPQSITVTGEFSLPVQMSNTAESS